MIKFIYSDDYNNFINYIKDIHNNTGIDIYDAEEVEIKEILNDILNISIFQKQRVIAIKNSFKIYKDLKDLKTDDYVYIQINKNIKGLEIDKIKVQDNATYIKELFKKNNIKENNALIQYIKDNFQDKVQIQNELNKIFNFIYPQKEIKDIEFIKQNIITKTNNVMIWDLVNSINSNNKKQLIFYFEKLKDNTTDLRYILTMIIREINLIIFINSLPNISSDVILKKLKIIGINTSTYGIQKIKSNKYDILKLKNIYHKLINLYSMSNEGKIDLEIGITLLLLSL